MAFEKHDKITGVIFYTENVYKKKKKIILSGLLSEPDLIKIPPFLLIFPVNVDCPIRSVILWRVHSEIICVRRPKYPAVYYVPFPEHVPSNTKTGNLNRKRIPVSTIWDNGPGTLQ